MGRLGVKIFSGESCQTAEHSYPQERGLDLFQHKLGKESFQESFQRAPQGRAWGKGQPKRKADDPLPKAICTLQESAGPMASQALQILSDYLE